MTETSNTAQTLRNIRILHLLGFLSLVGGYRHLELTRPPFNLKGNKVLAYTDHVNAHVVLHLFQRDNAPKE